jgi:hypothetical protein
MSNTDPTKYLGEPRYTGRVRQTKHNTENPTQITKMMSNTDPTKKPDKMLK